MTKEKNLADIREIVKVYLSSRDEKFVPGKSFVRVGGPIYDDMEVMSVISSLIESDISQGKKVFEFERLFAEYVGVNHAVAVNSGSSANLIALTAFIENGDAKPGDEIIMPATTFSTVACPAIQVGLTPVFIDVDKESYNIDVSEIARSISDKTSIIMPVHSLGNPADMEEIMPIAKKHNLKVLEDSCEAHGASINGKKAGSYGDMATLSFYVAHNITTGEGGMVFTNNKSYNHMLKSIREFGRIDQEGARFVEVGKLGIYDKRYVFERLGYNLRMTDLEASFGIEQFKKMDKLNEKRIENANYFTDEFKKFDNLVKLPSIKKGVVHTYYGYPIIIRKNAPFKRHDMVTFLENNLIETRPFFAGTLPDQPAFLNKKIKVIGDLHVSRWIRDNAIFIGCHAAIGEEERNYVVNKISDFLKKF